MGDFFNNVVIFLEDYYVYVIGVGLIIILMLIGFLASRHKVRKNNNQNGSMANINEVNTGSINDVANTLQANAAQPIDVVTYPDNNVTVSSQPTATNIEETEVLETNSINNFAAPSFEPIETPVSPMVEDVKPNNEDNFNRTEVIDFSSLNKPEPMAETSPVSPAFDMNSSFNTVAANVNEPVTIGSISPTIDTPVRVPVTDINAVEPTPIQSVNPMPANESVIETSPVMTEMTNEPIADIKPNVYNPFAIDKSQYDDILNGETSSSEEPKI